MKFFQLQLKRKGMILVARLQNRSNEFLSRPLRNLFLVWRSWKDILWFRKIRFSDLILGQYFYGFPDKAIFLYFYIFFFAAYAITNSTNNCKRLTVRFRTRQRIFEIIVIVQIFSEVIEIA